MVLASGGRRKLMGEGDSPGAGSTVPGGWLWEGLSKVSEQLWPRQMGPMSGEIGGGCK